MNRPSPIIKGVPDLKKWDELTKNAQLLPVTWENEENERLRAFLTYMRGHYAEMTRLFENCMGSKDSLNPIDAYNKGALIAYQAIVNDLDEILRM